METFMDNQDMDKDKFMDNQDMDKHKFRDNQAMVTICHTDQGTRYRLVAEKLTSGPHSNGLWGLGIDSHWKESECGGIWITKILIYLTEPLQ